MRWHACHWVSVQGLGLHGQGFMAAAGAQGGGGELAPGSLSASPSRREADRPAALDLSMLSPLPAALDLSIPSPQPTALDAVHQSVDAPAGAGRVSTYEVCPSGDAAAPEALPTGSRALDLSTPTGNRVLDLSTPSPQPGPRAVRCQMPCGLGLSMSLPAREAASPGSQCERGLHLSMSSPMHEARSADSQAQGGPRLSTLSPGSAPEALAGGLLGGSCRRGDEADAGAGRSLTPRRLEEDMVSGADRQTGG
jgi:hypothetical protein